MRIGTVGVSSGLLRGRDRELSARIAVELEQLGSAACGYPELKLVLTDDRSDFVRRARAHLADYLELPNYTNNLRRLGFTDADLAGEGSERLADQLVPGPDIESVVARAQEHLDAGADHVAVHVLTEDRLTVQSEQWALLAPALLE
jgi:probable F420-dependent oxidoreductase